MTTAATRGLLDHLVFRHPFRRYQQLALRHVEEVLGTEEDDGRFHLVAPPGSGKTILGIELARRFGRPTLVLAPTTAIVEQWRSQVALFLEDDADLDAVVSTTPERLAPITVLTYQVVSTPAGNEPLVLEAARESWITELVEAERVADVEAAHERLARLREHNRRTFDRELARRARRHKRTLLREGDAQVRRFLHDNARTHLERLTAHGVGTVLLDECHHLLDHWAVVVRSLLDGLTDPRVVGLTATLPDPDTPAEFENYDELLGDVDIEVPVPAVVKEGELAPFRDNVVFVEPTAAEDRYIGDVEGAFERAVAHITDREAFHRWLRRPLENADGRIDADGVAAVLREDPLLGLARLRMLTDAGDDLDDAPVPRDAREPAAADERARVVAVHALDELSVSEDPPTMRWSTSSATRCDPSASASPSAGCGRSARRATSCSPTPRRSSRPRPTSSNGRPRSSASGCVPWSSPTSSAPAVAWPPSARRSPATPAAPAGPSGPSSSVRRWPGSSRCCSPARPCGSTSRSPTTC
jgi:superfamily II DNA or RNA helicase